MAFLDGTTNLEQALGNQAQNQVSGVRDQYAQARKRQVSKLAANGQLMGGTADYPLADLANKGASAESDIYSNLASTLASVPAEDYLSQKGYNQNLDLASLIGRLSKPSSLQEALGLLSTGGRTAATVAAFM
jgi:hypothetical protein